MFWVPGHLIPIPGHISHEFEPSSEIKACNKMIQTLLLNQHKMVKEKKKQRFTITSSVFGFKLNWESADGFEDESPPAQT